jgi:hypothetical protein
MWRTAMRTQMRVTAIGFFLLLTTAAIAGDATETAALYQSGTIVTGQEEPQRLEGFVRCFEQVLVKVSGDPRLADDPRVATLAAEAASYVVDFRYRDRMEGIPVHDEQGTRERPHDLTVDFDPRKIDAALQTLGSGPWHGERPGLVVFAVVGNARGAYVLASDGEAGRDMREGLAAAARRQGMTAGLPDEATLQAFGLIPETLPTATSEALDDAAKASGGEIALRGTINWSSRDLGWVASWAMREAGRDFEWQIDGVGFDQAFRNGVGGAAQILSGNGAPE